ncbi:hypothetical protein QCA50_001753 [Cerrena zonata]|uniref:Uncharacterized protein n=1 Tax=Cerrena zonata TaxID=2478898 RepID=A0AAW0GPK4_9APHY
MSSPTSAAQDLPHYVLVSHTSGGGNPNPNAAPSATTFSHPIIEYHYADDSPNTLLPKEGEHVIVLDYSGSAEIPSTVKSLSSDLAAVGLRVTEAPGATTHEDGTIRNNKMFVIDTISLPEEIVDIDQFNSAHDVLARFKQRNAVLHQALEYGQHTAQLDTDAAPIPSLTSPVPEE